MSSLEVKNVICRGFQHISGFSSFHYFECIQNNRFAVMASQDLGGESVSAKKGGSLYLCEMCEEVCSLRYTRTINILYLPCTDVYVTSYSTRMWWKLAFLQVLVNTSDPFNRIISVFGGSAWCWLKCALHSAGP